MKKFNDYDSMFQEHGIEYVCGAGVAGLGVQALTFTMVTGGVVNFAAVGLADMANATYQVLGTNQTDQTDQATFGTKTTGGFVVADCDNSDVIDILIIGQIAGQQV